MKITAPSKECTALAITFVGHSRWSRVTYGTSTMSRAKETTSPISKANYLQVSLMTKDPDAGVV